MKKYILLNCVPTPYRTSFFNALYKRGLNLEVYYMRDREADRNWTINYEDLKHPYYIDRGFYKMIGRFHIHFNPKLLLKMFKAKNAEFIIAGSWNDLDVLVLVALKRIGILKNQIHFWSEANYLSIGALKDNILKKSLRKFVFNSSKKALIIPGKMAALTFEKWEINNRKFIELPNTIEEEQFLITDKEVEARFQNSQPIFLMPVRLVEEIKGIMNFFKAIEVENTRKGLFLIAGAGPDREVIQKFIDDQDLGQYIQLLGHCETEKMAALYKLANIFLLPSFSDPSPLSLVEALIMKLPVLISERCGNHFEAVREGENGYLFDPKDANSIKLAFESILLCKHNWQKMGELSSELYYKVFNKPLVVDNFIQKLNEN